MGKRNSAESLERFAIRIEEKLRRAGSSSTIENLVCRSLTDDKNPSVAARMREKWVEWRYGKAKETHEVTGEGGGPITVTVKLVKS